MTKSKPMTSRVYELIYCDIVNHVFAINEIITESQLVKRYLVSKAPVREALISLCDRNVLKSIPRAGYQIVQILPRDVKEIMETRKAIELFLIKSIYLRVSDDQTKALYEYDKAIESADLNQLTIYEQWEKNVGFHLLLASYAGNDYMLEILRGVLRDNARAAAQYRISSGKPFIDQHHSGHQRLIKAIETKNLELIIEEMLLDIGFLAF